MKTEPYTSYQDDVAQSIIERTYGTKELWRATSYIMQNERCTLLTGSNKDKMDLLNRLSFNMDDPKQYIKRIEDEIKSVTDVYKTRNIEFETRVNQWQSQLQIRPAEREEYRTDEQISELASEIERLEVELKNMHSKLLQNQVNKGKIDSLGNMLKLKVDMLNLLPTYDHDELTKINQELDNYRRQKNVQETNTNYVARWNTAYNKLMTKEKWQDENHPGWRDHVGLNDVSYSSQDIWKLEQDKRVYETNLSLCSSLGIPYDKTVIDEEIRAIEEQINHVNGMKASVNTLLQIVKLENDLKSFVIDFDLDADTKRKEELEKELKELGTKLIDLQNGLNVIPCPHCNNNLRIVSGGTIVSADHDPVDQSVLVSVSSDISRLRSEINMLASKIMTNRSTLERQKYMTEQLNTLLPQLSNRDEVQTFVNNPITPDTRRLNTLKTIQVVEPVTINIPMYKSIIEWQQIKKSFDELDPPSTETFDISVEELAIKIRTHEERVNLINKTNTERIQLENEITHIRQEISTIVLDERVSEVIYNIMSEDIKAKTQSLDQHRYATTMINTEKELLEIKAYVTNLHTKIINLSKLRQKAIDVECIQQQNTVDSINYALQDILESIFEHPIVVELRLYKQLKTRKEQKQQVNLHIQYKGAEYDSISSLSGGEGDRLSLAMIIALNRISTSPFLLIDESMSSLNEDLREKCLDSLRESIPHTKTVICVNHEDVEGRYDRVIYLS
jgi:energy-coupling factor transporter ATP-binding protein EcfA2